MAKVGYYVVIAAIPAVEDPNHCAEAVLCLG
jgi:hypothetical protein